MYNTAYTTFHYLFSKAVALTTVVMAATTVVMAVTTVVMAVTTAEVKCHNYVSVVNDVCPIMPTEKDASLLTIISIITK